MKATINNHSAHPLWGLVLICILGLTPAYADSTLELSIIPLKHRPATSLMPSLHPLIKAPATLSAAGNQLLLRADKSTGAQLRLLIDELDKPLRQYQIEVRQGENSGVQTQRLHANIKQPSIYTGGATQPTESSITVRRTTGTKRGASLHSIKALEGYPTYIETGKEIPFWLLSKEGTPGQEYKAVRTGFYATLLSSDNKRFVMQLSTQQQNAIKGSKSLRSNRSQSTLSGRLGEWVLVGGSRTRESHKDLSINSKTSRTNRGQQALYLRVTESD